MRAFILRAVLPVGGEAVQRMLAVSAACSFKKLHRILQVAFDWQDYHMHDFCLYDDRGTLQVKIESEPGDEEYWEPEDDYITTERETRRLSSFLPTFRHMVYTYDFGDGWEHFLELERVEEDYEGPLPFCKVGEGTAPPEDVGGEVGYLDFLDTIRDPENPLREQLMDWAKEQGWRPFDLEAVNEQLAKL